MDMIEHLVIIMIIIIIISLKVGRDTAISEMK